MAERSVEKHQIQIVHNTFNRLYLTIILLHIQVKCFSIVNQKSNGHLQSSTTVLFSLPAEVTDTCDKYKYIYGLI